MVSLTVFSTTVAMLTMLIQSSLLPKNELSGKSVKVSFTPVRLYCSLSTSDSRIMDRYHDLQQSLANEQLDLGNATKYQRTCEKEYKNLNSKVIHTYCLCIQICIQIRYLFHLVKFQLCYQKQHCIEDG